MRKHCLLLLTAILCCSHIAFSQKRIGYEKPGDQEKRLAWWTNDRFGMFIHWGLYALPARHEWVKKYEKLTNEDYQKYFEQFNPDLYNPKEWAKAAKAAGMKYAVITTKHHEGFCLFDSKFTDYKATNTQAKRDLIKEWVEAFRAEGLKVGFYYSLLDWHHPDFTVDKHHPQQPADNSDSAYARLNQGKDMSKYREYMHNQVRELLTNYGKIDIMWLDFSYPGKNGKGHEDWGSEELMKMMHKLQPGLIVDNRLDLNDYEDGFDFVTPEQVVVSEWQKVNGKKVAWETCQTFSGSWGYYRDEETWKSPNQLLQLLIGSVSKGGNLLLNVGPTARGLFDYRANNALNAIGEWMQLNSSSIYGCTQAPDEFKAPPGTMLTYNPVTKKLYIHVLVWPFSRLTLPGFDQKVKYVQFLHDNSEIKYLGRDNQGSKDLVLTMPVKKPPVEIPVIELTLK